MKRAQSRLALQAKPQRRPTLAPARLDGIRNWPKTLERLLWMLLRAGVEPKNITARVARILEGQQGVKGLHIPPAEVLEYARVLTYWRNEPAFLDELGEPRALPIAGRSSFTGLVRQALPGAAPEAVLAVLRRHQLVALTRQDRVTLKSAAFVPKNAQRAEILAYTLAAVAGIIETCHRNVTRRDPAESVGRLQRVASAERFDLKYIEEYDLFLRDQASDFLLKQDAWLKRHEEKPPARNRARTAQVGVGIFGFRAR